MNIHDEYARGTEDWHEMIENTNFAKYGFRQTPLVHRDIIEPQMSHAPKAVTVTLAPDEVCSMCEYRKKLPARSVCIECWAEMHD